LIHDKFKDSDNTPPPLIKLNDDKIKYIMKAARALNARLMLVDIYQDDS